MMRPIRILGLLLLHAPALAQAASPAAAPTEVELRPLARDPFDVEGKTIDLDAERARLLAWLDQAERRDTVRKDPRALRGYTSAEGSLRWYPHVIGPDVRDASKWQPSFASHGVAVPLFEAADAERAPGADERLTELLLVDARAPQLTTAELDPDSIEVAVEDDAGAVIRYDLAQPRPEEEKAQLRNGAVVRYAFIVDGEVRGVQADAAHANDKRVIAIGGSRERAQVLADALAAAARAAGTNAAQAPAGSTVVVGAARGPTPGGSDPADIRAMQGAEAMLAAEARLRAQIKAGKIKGIDRVVSFDEIASWPYEDGLLGLPRAIKELSGKRVLMTGFMLPLDEVEHIKEFLLVQSLWSCCYGQPPDINGIVRVVMQGDARIDYQFDPIKVVGKFIVEETKEEGYCVDIYQLHAESVEVIR